MSYNCINNVCSVIDRHRLVKNLISPLILDAKLLLKILPIVNNKIMKNKFEKNNLYISQLC